MTKDSRAGGKFCGSHTTCIPLAARVADIATANPHVTKVVLGFIKAGLGAGRRRVKFTDDIGSILLSVRDNASHQELRVYVVDIQTARTEIARRLRTENIPICFRS